MESINSTCTDLLCVFAGVDLLRLHINNILFCIRLFIHIINLSLLIFMSRDPELIKHLVTLILIHTLSLSGLLLTVSAVQRSLSR